MKPHDKYFFATLFMWVVGTILAIGTWLWFEMKEVEKVVVQPPLFPHYSLGEHGKAHRFHGIKFAEQEASGEWIFYRDGKRCRLFAYR